MPAHAPAALRPAHAPTRPLSHPLPRALPRTLLHPLATAAVAACLLAVWPAAVQAQGNAGASVLELPAQPLSAALAQLAQRSGASLAYTPELVQGKQASPVQAAPNVGAALAQMLRGTGLQAQQQGQTWVIQPAPAAPSSAAPVAPGTVSLPAVTVVAPTETATGPVTGYAARRSATATKTDTPLLETPQSISVVGQEEIEDRAASNLMEVARYSAGVQAESYGNAAHANWLNLRGFSATGSTYVNGLKAPTRGYLTRLTNPFEVERFEALRGPSSSLYGLGDAGGIIHIVTKKAGPHAERQVQAEVGHPRNALAVDVGSALNAQQTAHWRLVAAGSHNRQFSRYPGHGRMSFTDYVLAPSLALKPSAATSLVLHARLYGKQGFDQETEFLGQDLRSSSGWLNGNPNANSSKTRQHELGYEFSHRFNDKWSIEQNFVVAKHSYDGHWLYGEGPADPQTGDLEQSIYWNNNSMHHLALDTRLLGKLRTGEVEHSLAFGLDAHTQRFKQIHTSSEAPALNIFLPPEPQYAQNIGLPSDWDYRYQVQVRQRQMGLYAQDQMSLGPWRLTLGGRYDRVRTRNTDYVDHSSTRQSEGAFSGRVALGYVSPGGLAPYLSYAQSFLPSTGTTYEGEAFKPTRGKQWELGLKYQPPGQDLLLTAALFDLRKTNVATRDPVNPGFQVQTGEIRSRGLELEAKGSVTRQLKLTGQITYQDVKISRSNDGNQGNRPENVPKLIAAAWVDYSFAGVPGLSAGLGVRHVGKRFAYDDNAFGMPAHTLLDAALRYERGPWQLALNVSNLANKKYVASYGWGYYPGTPRTITASLKYRF